MVINISCKFETGTIIAFFIKFANISKKAKYGLDEVNWRSVDDLQ